MERWLKRYRIWYICMCMIGAGVLLAGVNLAAHPFFMYRYEKKIADAYKVIRDMEPGRQDLGEDELEVLDECNRYVNIVIADEKGNILYGIRGSESLRLQEDILGGKGAQYREDAVPEKTVDSADRVTGLALHGLISSSAGNWYVYIHKSMRSVDRTVQIVQDAASLTLAVVLPLLLLLFWILSRRFLSPVWLYGRITEALASDDMPGSMPAIAGFPDRPEFMLVAEKMYRKIMEANVRTRNYEYIVQATGMDEEKQLDNQKKLVSHITHQLKTPLAIISSQVELDHTETDPEKKNYYYHSVLEEIDKMSLLINDILRGYETERTYVNLSLRRTNISDILLDLVPKYESWLRSRQIRFSGDIGQQLYTMADPGQIEQAVHNCMMNAVDHTRKGKSVTLSLKREGKWNVILIHNDGDGIPEEELEKIWERGHHRESGLYSGRGDASHAGLGLYIVRMIVMNHKGTCEAVNDPTGVTFVLHLPAC